MGAVGGGWAGPVYFTQLLQSKHERFDYSNASTLTINTILLILHSKPFWFVRGEGGGRGGGVVVKLCRRIQAMQNSSVFIIHIPVFVSTRVVVRNKHAWEQRKRRVCP